METSRSAKRVILFLIGLNVATILTAVTIFSSGMFVANANQGKSCLAITSNSINSPLAPGGTYTGQLLNTQGNPQANIELTLTGSAKKIKTATLKATGRGKQPISFKDGGTLVATDTHNITSFSISVTEAKSPNNQVTVHFINGRFSGQSVSGTYTIDAPSGDTYGGYVGQWTIHPSST